MRCFIIMLVIFGAALAAPKTQRIVGGSPTTVQQYPYMSNMQYGMGFYWSQSCGGTLITTTTVVSAAHCYYGDSPEVWRVRLGTSFASSGGSEHYIAQIHIHEQYSHSTLEADVALLHLVQPAILSSSVQVASIAGPHYKLLDGSVVTAIGWGLLSASSGIAPEQLQHVDVNVIAQETCAERYAYLKAQPGFGHWPDVIPGMVCSGVLNVGGKDACSGDSGGPLVQANVLVGITSWGYSCAHQYYPGVNARVSTYSDWVAVNA